MAKMYTVMRDGAQLAEYKTLPAARKLAETENAEVFCDGERVYPVEDEHAEAPVEEAPVDAAEDNALKDEETRNLDQLAKELINAIDWKRRKRPVVFTLRRKMNVRKEPSLSAEKLKVLNTGADVEVKAIANDWLCLVDGSYILLESGRNALPIRW